MVGFRHDLDAEPAVARKGLLIRWAEVVAVVVGGALIPGTARSSTSVVAPTRSHLVPIHIEVEDIGRVGVQIEPEPVIAGRNGVGEPARRKGFGARGHSDPVMWSR